jgi:hypothetical protein
VSRIASTIGAADRRRKFHVGAPTHLRDRLAFEGGLTVSIIGPVSGPFNLSRQPQSDGSPSVFRVRSSRINAVSDSRRVRAVVKIPVIEPTAKLVE